LLVKSGQQLARWLQLQVRRCNAVVAPPFKTCRNGSNLSRLLNLQDDSVNLIRNYANVRQRLPVSAAFYVFKI
jgi:hypothetical protein